MDIKKERKRTVNYQRYIKYAVCIAVLAVLTVILVFIVKGCSEHIQTKRSIKEGISYLESLESKDPAELSALRKEIDDKRRAAQKKEALDKLMDPNLDVWPLFKDYVILGDSRAVGFYYFDYLEESRVLAGGGDTIRNIEMHMDEIVELSPSYIFLCYGLNDISIGYWETSDKYIDEYMKVIDVLKKKLPDATIIISSTLPAQDPAFDVEPVWRDIPKWSEALGERCEKEGIIYVDNTQICEEHSDLWQDDGIHVREEFYPFWAKNLMAGAMTGQSKKGAEADEG